MDPWFVRCSWARGVYAQISSFDKVLPSQRKASRRPDLDEARSVPGEARCLFDDERKVKVVLGPVGVTAWRQPVETISLCAAVHDAELRRFGGILQHDKPMGRPGKQAQQLVCPKCSLQGLEIAVVIGDSHVSA